MSSKINVNTNFMSIQNPPMGLLTTVANLQPEYKIRYQTNFVKVNKSTTETPLDLSVKAILDRFESYDHPPQITPPTTPTQLLSPLKKRYRNEINLTEITNIDTEDKNKTSNCDEILVEFKLNASDEKTPKKPIKPTPPTRTSKTQNKGNKNNSTKKQNKAIRKLKFDEHKSSPVSGTIIRSLEEIDLENLVEKCGDIDPQYNIVEVTDEAKAELAQIENVIGAYVCKLCRLEFEDAFGLARHRCSCIVLLEYRCPECGKRFNCPANLASHRRWHKPKDQTNNNKAIKIDSDLSERYNCDECGKNFKRQAYLRKHQSTHRKEIPNSLTSNSVDSTDYHVNYSSAPSKIIFHLEPSPSLSNHSTHHYDSVNSNSNSNSSLFLSGNEGCVVYDEVEPKHKKFRNMLSDNFTEDENIAAAALAHLRNGASVIKHTTALAV